MENSSTLHPRHAYMAPRAKLCPACFQGFQQEDGWAAAVWYKLWDGESWENFQSVARLCLHFCMIRKNRGKCWILFGCAQCADLSSTLHTFGMEHCFPLDLTNTILHLKNSKSKNLIKTEVFTVFQQTEGCNINWLPGHVFQWHVQSSQMCVKTCDPRPSSLAKERKELTITCLTTSYLTLFKQTHRN